MADKLDVKQGTLALMILKTLEVLGPLRPYPGHRLDRPLGKLKRHSLDLEQGVILFDERIARLRQDADQGRDIQV